MPEVSVHHALPVLASEVVLVRVFQRNRIDGKEGSEGKGRKEGGGRKKIRY